MARLSTQSAITAHRSIITNPRCLVLFLFSVVCFCPHAGAGPYTAIYVFGGVHSDVGNFIAWAPSHDEDDITYQIMRLPPFFRGRLSDGEIFPEILAELYRLGPLQPSTQGGTVYAWVDGGGIGRDANDGMGGGPGSIPHQIDQAIADLGGDSLDPEALYVISPDWEASSYPGDFSPFRPGYSARLDSTMREAADTLAAAVQRIVDRGARHIVFLGPLGRMHPRIDADLPYVPFARSEYNAGYMGINIEQYAKFEEHVPTALSKVQGSEVIYFRKDRWIEEAFKHFEYPRVPFLHRDRFLPRPESELTSNYIFLDYYPFVDATVREYLFESLAAAAHESLGKAVAAAVDRAPVEASRIPDLDLLLDLDVFRRDLNYERVVFADEDGHNLRYSAASYDTAIAAVRMQGTTIIVTPVGLGSTTITIIANDTYKTGESTFDVTVEAFGYTVSSDLDAADGDQSTGVLSAVSPDWQFSIQLFLDDIEGAQAFAASVAYDSDQLTYEGFDSGTLFPSVRAQPVAASTAIALTSDSLAAGTESSSGLLGTLRFRTTTSFSGTEVQLVNTTLSRSGRSETLDDALIARLSANSCDFSGNGAVDFSDFLLFAQSFLTTSTDANYDPKLDLDTDNDIDFTDFLLFVKDFGTKLASE